MGGNALKDFGARRVESEQARAIGKVVCAALDAMLIEDGFDLKCHLTRAYRTKPDYGDLDILLPKPFVDRVGHRPLVARLQAAMGGDWPFAEDYIDAPVFHTAIALPEGGSLQIDLMPIPLESYEFAKDYYAWNDLSKMFTILAKQMNGLRFGNDGLTRSIKGDGRVLGSVVFTRDFDEALAFLGYDTHRYHQGFDTLEDMFEFAASNPRFNTSMYQLENRTNHGRSQDKKRVTYQAFLTWMQQRELPEYDWEQDKTDWLELALDHFPGAREQFALLQQQKQLEDEVKLRYNGEIVTRLTGIKGPPLGKFMNEFKKHCGETVFKEWLATSSASEITDAIRAFHAQYRPATQLDTSTMREC